MHVYVCMCLCAGVCVQVFMCLCVCVCVRVSVYFYVCSVGMYARKYAVYVRGNLQHGGRAIVPPTAAL